jgi:hypothetical protein
MATSKPAEPTKAPEKAPEKEPKVTTYTPDQQMVRAALNIKD